MEHALVLFSGGLLSLSIILVSKIPGIAYSQVHLFSLTCTVPLYGYTIDLSIHLLINNWGYFQFRATVNNDAKNILTDYFL